MWRPTSNKRCLKSSSASSTPSSSRRTRSRSAPSPSLVSPATHYRFSVSGFGADSGALVTANQIDYWLADGTGVVLKYEMVIESRSGPTTDSTAEVYRMEGSAELLSATSSCRWCCPPTAWRFHQKLEPRWRSPSGASPCSPRPPGDHIRLRCQRWRRSPSARHTLVMRRGNWRRHPARTHDDPRPATCLSWPRAAAAAGNDSSKRLHCPSWR